METSNQGKNLLTEFLNRFEQLPADITTALINVSSNADEKNILTSLSPVLNNQFKEISLKVAELSTKADKQSLEEVDEVLKVSSALPLLNSAKLALPSIGSLIGKLGIDEIVKAIKKIIRKIFEILKKELPAWLDAVFLVIDEIINMLFGSDSQKARTLFSETEQNFLKELTQLAKLENATYRASRLREDED